MSVPPTLITTMRLGNLCLDGANPAAVTAVTCNGAASQNWYWLWGQIRNVQNALCLDAVSSSASDTTARAVSLTACGVHPPVRTQLWIKSADHILINSASGNCIHQQGSAVQVGTGICAKRGSDILTGPKNFVGINGFIADIGTAQCTVPRVRKDIRDLSDAERRVFFDALNTLNRLPSLMGRRNRYQDYVASHGAGGRWFHGTPYFLPWHRYYTAVLEQDIQKITGNATFGIPYWAWGSDATTWQLPSTGVLTADRFGTTGTGTTPCIRDGFMKGEWVPTDASCLMRAYNPEPSSSSSVSTYTEDFILLAITTNPQTRQRYTDYDGFRNVIESLPHNNFHMVIAGSSRASQMGNPSVSVNDPIFFMHHNNIDRHWQYFQNANPTLAGAFNGAFQYPPGSGNTVNVDLSDIMISFNVPVSAGMGVRKGPLCHSYQPYSKSIASVAVQFARLARRSSAEAGVGLQRRTVSTGQELVAELEPAVAGKLIQNDLAINTDLVPISAIAERKDLPVPPRADPAALTDDFLERMSEVMDVDKEKIRALEKAAFEMMQELREKTDQVLKDEFGKDAGSANFEQHAVAVKVAIAIMEVAPAPHA
ncbi:hypothetical protein HDU67_008091 [Dinochytrium kinnereticum]|nr:hypothetical protein HDU67_008091 [Dinochytrium kinnereticum]